MAKRIERAIVILDQASGALRIEEHAVIGLDLRPDVEAAADAADISITIGVPGLSGGGFAGVDLSEFAGGRPVVPLPELTYAGDYGLTGISGLSDNEPATALVAADRRLRGEALSAGMAPAPHAALLPLMAKGQDIRAARVSSVKGALERLYARGGVVPMHFQPAPNDTGEWALIAFFTQDALVGAVIDRLSVSSLDYNTMTDDLVWARIDGNSQEVRKALDARRILYAEPGQVLIAIAPGENAEALHIHGGHGHSELLVADPGLMQPPGDVDDGLYTHDLQTVIDSNVILEPVVKSQWTHRNLQRIRPDCVEVTAEYDNDLARYTGAVPLDTQGTIDSRHSAHPDNKRAEAALLTDLRALGYNAHRHDFTHAGRTHSNIIADLPGTGHTRIRPDILARYRELLRRPTLDRSSLAADALGGGLTDILEGLSDSDLRAFVEAMLALHPWHPWWQKASAIPGIGAEIVIVGAHMDSTAGFEPGYSAPSDPAPGSDDNGSGTAGVLSLARYFAGWRDKLTHTLRFCFFNAEESGLVGSKAYASHLKAMGAPIRAVYCTDMIGFNSDANRLFELHAGFTDPTIRDLSVPLAEEVAAAAAAYGELAPAQIYKGTGYSGAPDRDIYDGAINRSDHAAFHQQGYPALLGSEDFFVNLGTEPGSDPNPNYHRESDTVVDTSYAKDIVCAFAKAIKDKAL
jgi:hypothetical protein